MQFILDNFDIYVELYEDDGSNEFLEDVLDILDLINSNFEEFTPSKEERWKKSMYNKWEDWRLELKQNRGEQDD